MPSSGGRRPSPPAAATHTAPAPPLPQPPCHPLPRQRHACHTGRHPPPSGKHRWQRRGSVLPFRHSTPSGKPCPAVIRALSAAARTTAPGHSSAAMTTLPPKAATTTAIHREYAPAACMKRRPFPARPVRQRDNRCFRSPGQPRQGPAQSGARQPPPHQHEWLQVPGAAAPEKTRNSVLRAAACRGATVRIKHPPVACSTVPPV